MKIPTVENERWRVNPDYEWARIPRWMRRLNGFFAYQLCSWASLFVPEKIDRILVDELTKQYLPNVSAQVCEREKEKTNED